MIIFMCFKLFSIYPAKKTTSIQYIQHKKESPKIYLSLSRNKQWHYNIFLINKYAEFSFSEKNKQILKRFGGEKEHH